MGLEEIKGVISDQVATALQQMQAEQAQMSQWDQTRFALFPSLQGGAIPPSQGIEGSLSGFLADTRTSEQDAYTDPETGAIELPNGVVIDPNGGPSNGVIYAPNSTAPGSFSWLRKAASTWSEDKANDWRKKLNQLGYGVAKSGKFDATLAQALDSYFRNKYFFGKETPADGSVGTREGAREVASQTYDPVLMRQAIRTGFKAAVGDDPTEDELEMIFRPVRREMVQAIQKGVDPQHAALKAEESIAQDIVDSPAGETAQRRSDFQGLENTDLMDSFVSLGQLMS